VTNKLARGTFPASCFLAVLAALEQDGVALEGNLIRFRSTRNVPTDAHNIL
jgi:hypothetical protein